MRKYFYWDVKQVHPENSIVFYNGKRLESLPNEARYKQLLNPDFPAGFFSFTSYENGKLKSWAIEIRDID